MDDKLIKSKFILGSVSESLETTLLCVSCKQLPNPNCTHFCPSCMSVSCEACLSGEQRCKLCKQQATAWKKSNIHWEKDFSKLVFKCECGFADRWINFTHQCATDALNKVKAELADERKKAAVLNKQLLKLKEDYKEIENVLNFISNKRKIKTEV